MIGGLINVSFVDNRGAKRLSRNVKSSFCPPGMRPKDHYTDTCRVNQVSNIMSLFILSTKWFQNWGQLVFMLENFYQPNPVLCIHDEISEFFGGGILLIFYNCNLKIYCSHRSESTCNYCSAEVKEMSTALFLKKTNTVYSPELFQIGQPLF